MSSHLAPRGLDAAGTMGTSSQMQSMPRPIRDGVISGGGTNLRVSLELVTQRPDSRSYVIRGTGATLMRETSTLEQAGRGIRTSDLGWSPQQAVAIRQGLSSWAEDWDDPALDAYNVYLQG